MLFTPWRNEETDLLGNLKSYEDRCMVLSSVIKEQMKQYAVCKLWGFQWNPITNK